MSCSFLKRLKLEFVIFGYKLNWKEFFEMDMINGTIIFNTFVFILPHTLKHEVCRISYSHYVLNLREN